MHCLVEVFLLWVCWFFLFSLLFAFSIWLEMDECGGFFVLFDGVELRGDTRFIRVLTIGLMRFLQMGMNGVF